MHSTTARSARYQDRDHPMPSRRGFLAHLTHQLRFDILAQIRNPSAMFFTAVLPLVFLAVFALSSQDQVETARYFVPAMMVLAAASGTLTNIAVTIAYLREYGQLKRVLVTPVHRSAFLGSRLIAAALVSTFAVAILGIVGAVAFDAGVQTWWALTLAIALCLIVGSALGLATAALIRSETAAAPLANAIALPMLLASGAFFPLDTAPAWFEDTSRFLPFAEIVGLAVDSYAAEVRTDNILFALAVTTAWTALSIIAIRAFFSWAPVRRR